MPYHYKNDSFLEWSVLLLEEECESNAPPSEGGGCVEPFFFQRPSGVQSLKYSGLHKRKLLMRGAQGAIYSACDKIEPEHPREVIVKRLYGQHDPSYFSVGVEVSVLRETSLMSYLMQEQEKTQTQSGQTSSREGNANDALLSTISESLSSPPMTVDRSARILALYRIVEAPMEDICLVLEACDLDMEQLFALSRYPPVCKDWENRDGLEHAALNGVQSCRMRTPRYLSDDESVEGCPSRENLGWAEGWPVGAPLALDFSSESSEEFIEEGEAREKKSCRESRRQVEEENVLEWEGRRPHRSTPSAHQGVLQKKSFLLHSSFPSLEGKEKEQEREKVSDDDEKCEKSGQSASSSTPPELFSLHQQTEDEVLLREKRAARDVLPSSVPSFFPRFGGAYHADDVHDASPLDHDRRADRAMQMGSGLFPSPASLPHKCDASEDDGWAEKMKTTGNACCPLLRELSLIRYLLRRFLRVLCFLHDTCNVCHRDIKPTNWLIRREVEGGGSGIRLGDFGSARFLFPHDCDEEVKMRDPPSGKEAISEGEQMEENCATVRNGNDVAGAPLTPLTFRTTRCYISPECILGEEYDFKVDIWALGVVFVEMLLQRHLFYSMSEVGVLSEVYTLLIPSSEKQKSTVESMGEDNLEASPVYSGEQKNDDPLFSTRLSELIAPLIPPEGVKLAHELLALNPESRLSASQALRHPFLHFEGWEKEDALGERLLRQKLESFE